MEWRIELGGGDEHPFSVPEVNILAIQLFQPGVLVSFGEPQEQTLHFYAAASDEQRAKPPRAEIAEPLHQNVRLVKGFALWHLVQQFEDRPLGRRHGQWPFPLTPRLPYIAALRQIAAGIAPAFLPVRAAHFTFEKLLRIVKNEPGLKVQLENPSRGFAGAVQVDFAVAPRGQIMREPLQFERCSPADGERTSQEHLKGDDNRLPPEGFVAGI